MIHQKINDNHRSPKTWNDLLVNSCYKASMFSEKQPKSKIIFTNGRALVDVLATINFLLLQNTNSLLEMSYDRSDTFFGKVSLLQFTIVGALGTGAEAPTATRKSLFSQIQIHGICCSADVGVFKFLIAAEFSRDSASM
ncbi:MAG: hypothetical protein ACTHML_10725 [Ginsengibacter sp.]